MLVTPLWKLFVYEALPMPDHNSVTTENGLVLTRIALNTFYITYLEAT